MKSFQILMSVMNQKDHEIIKKANIQSNAIIINQAGNFKKETFTHKGFAIQFITFDERGVGLSRNNALMRAEAGIVLLSDQSVVYEDNYTEAILAAFNDLPDADIILFNVPFEDHERRTYEITKKHRVRRYNCLRYGAVRMAFKTEPIRKKGLYFSLLFGGGATYSSGEDSLFLYDSIKAGMRVYAVPITLGRVLSHESTWFEGYTDKFFVDKGAFFKNLSPIFYKFFIIQLALRKRRTMGDGRDIKEMINLMMRGANEF